MTNAVRKRRARVSRRRIRSGGSAALGYSAVTCSPAGPGAPLSCGYRSVEHRSGCPINLTLEMLGDRWSLIVVHDILFGGRRHFRELLNGSEEGIASNILADRLKRLVEAGLLTRADDPTHRQKAIYSLAEPAIQLVPLLAQMGAWGRRHTPATPELSIRAELLEVGGPAMWEAFMAELRALHLGHERPERSVMAELRAAYEAVVAERARGTSPAGS